MRAISFIAFSLSTSLLAQHAVLKADSVVSGPTGAQRSTTCLRIYSGGKVVFAASKGATGSAFEDRLSDTDFGQLEELLKSKAVRKLPDKFAPPHKAVDYFETFTVDIGDKTFTAREYYVASLEERTRYPSALIVLMDRIAKIEEAVASRGKPTEIPADCAKSAK